VAEPERTVVGGIATDEDAASTDLPSTDLPSTDLPSTTSTASTAAGGEPAPADLAPGHAPARSTAMPGPGSVPLQRDTDDGRHRVGVPVTAVITQAGGAASGLARRGGAHRIMRRTGRHSGRHRAAEEIDPIARRSIDDVDAMAHRRSIGNRLTRGIGRTAL
jgi:hypothetical protein